MKPGGSRLSRYQTLPQEREEQSYHETSCVEMIEISNATHEVLANEYFIYEANTILRDFGARRSFTSMV